MVEFKVFQHFRQIIVEFRVTIRQIIAIQYVLAQNTQEENAKFRRL